MSASSQIDSILHAYLQAIDAGQKPDPEEIVRQHPECADELRAFFADQQKMDAFVNSMHKAQSDVTIGADGADLPSPSGRGDGREGELPTIRYFGDYELLEEIARGGMGMARFWRSLGDPRGRRTRAPCCFHRTTARWPPVTMIIPFTSGTLPRRSCVKFWTA
ncbi:MAG: hypothetical protein FJ303_09185 [Planctomycetes bacterium]|nr:hypothetical protein [Planctomycetota bacterium]